MDRLRADIRHFRSSSGAERVVVLWTATTERRADVRPGLNTTEEELLAAISAGSGGGSGGGVLAPSTLYGVAALLEDCAFINGSPQNSLVPGLRQMAENRRLFLAGDDFKSGQTKVGGFGDRADQGGWL